MLVLGIDTSGRQGSVALLRVEKLSAEKQHAEDQPLLTLELVPISGGQYSELLVPSIAEMLVHHGYERRSIGLIGVASGPGSFTGLRIAIATTKGLAEAFGIPVVAVSMLEAIARDSGAQGPIVAALDAQRSEIFFGEYVLNPSAERPARMIREGIASFADFTSIFAACDPPVAIFTPDEALATRLHAAALNAQRLARPTAESFARIAHRKFLAGVRDDVATLDANYLRRSDAEIFAAPKPGRTPR